jgi:hypothetical protein
MAIVPKTIRTGIVCIVVPSGQIAVRPYVPVEVDTPTRILDGGPNVLIAIFGTA